MSTWSLRQGRPARSTRSPRSLRTTIGTRLATPCGSAAASVLRTRWAVPVGVRQNGHRLQLCQGGRHRRAAPHLRGRQSRRRGEGHYGCKQRPLENKTLKCPRPKARATHLRCLSLTVLTPQTSGCVNDTLLFLHFGVCSISFRVCPASPPPEATSNAHRRPLESTGQAAEGFWEIFSSLNPREKFQRTNKAFFLFEFRGNGVRS